MTQNLIPSSSILKGDTEEDVVFWQHKNFALSAQIWSQRVPLVLF